MEFKIWTPEKYINITDQSYDKFAIVVLNRPISLSPITITHLWNSAQYRVLVDGGANRWNNFLKSNCNGIKTKPPDLLTGDFDSITNTVLKEFEALGCQINCTPDQNETDFTKALLALKPILNAYNINSVVVLLDSSGRIDHILSHIHTMLKAYRFLSGVDIFILCKSSLSWLLGPGTHTIHVPEQFVITKNWCSFVPVGQQCLVTTTGFKWNLKNDKMEFGGLISTSNTYASNLLTIETDGFIYFSMGLEEKD